MKTIHIAITVLVALLSGCATTGYQNKTASTDDAPRPPAAVNESASILASDLQEQDKAQTTAKASAKATAAQIAAEQNLPEGTDIILRPGKDGRTIQEYRFNGFLYAVKVVPKKGAPYFLVAVDNTGNFIRADRPQMLIPSWTIFEWK